MAHSLRTLMTAAGFGGLVALTGVPAQAANPCAPKAANPCAAKPANPCAAKPANPCAVKK